MNSPAHARSYWSSVTGGCKKTAPPGPPVMCRKSYNPNFCLGPAPMLPSTPAAPNPVWVNTPEECCGACSTTEGCKGWAFGKSTKGPKFACNMKSSAGPTNEGNCTSGCRYGPCKSGMTPIVDLWQRPLDGSREGPAHGFNSTCDASNRPGDPGSNTQCVPGPNGDHRYDGYEDALFEVRPSRSSSFS
jgi:hypothetical protein